MSAPSRASASLAEPRHLFPFLLVSLIWGGTWLVIRDQISTVPPGWSITYRFVVAAAGMFVLVRWRGQPLTMPAGGWRIALGMGAMQFFLNFSFVYNAERFITSGLVAVLFALLMVPNAILGRLFLGQSISRGFVLGSLIAVCGIALMFWHEWRATPATLAEVLAGIGLTLGGILSASGANILQATDKARRLPFLTLLAWSMLFGMGINAAVTLVTVGAPVFDPRPTYALGILYLGLLGSVITFPLYYPLVREVGAGKAAYSSVLVPVVAMVLSTLFEGFEWSALAVSGAVLAMAGMLVALRGRDATRATTPPKAP